MNLRFIFVLLATGCTTQRAYPTHLRLSGEFSNDEAQEVWDAAAQWQAAGAHLTIDSAAPGVVLRGVTEDITPVFPDNMPKYGGLTDSEGVHLNLAAFRLRWFNTPHVVRRVAAHEFGHVLGLGPPADDAEHIEAQGDIMCAAMECSMVGNDDGVLSADDIAAWRAGGAR